jgi:hypothetical protein
MRLNKKKAQSILDFILAFGALIFLAAGLVRIWVWFGANYAKRQVDFQNTRLASGQASAFGYSSSHFPIDDGLIFYGTPSGSVGKAVPGYNSANPTTGGGSDGAEAVCASARSAAAVMRQNADDMDEQADELDDFISLADDWYDPLYWVALLLGIDISDYESARDQLWEYAPKLRQQADQLEASACG